MAALEARVREDLSRQLEAADAASAAAAAANAAVSERERDVAARAAAAAAAEAAGGRTRTELLALRDAIGQREAEVRAEIERLTGRAEDVARRNAALAARLEEAER